MQEPLHENLCTFRAGREYSLLLAKMVDTDSEEWRRECEARGMAKLGTHRRRQRHQIVLQRRGKQAAHTLKHDTMTLRLMRNMHPMTDEQIEAAMPAFIGTYGFDVADRAKTLLLAFRKHKADQVKAGDVPGG